jgi:hypothetical protein
MAATRKQMVKEIDRLNIERTEMIRKIRAATLREQALRDRLTHEGNNMNREILRQEIQSERERRSLLSSAVAGQDLRIRILTSHLPNAPNNSQMEFIPQTRDDVIFYH